MSEDCETVPREWWEELKAFIAEERGFYSRAAAEDILEESATDKFAALSSVAETMRSIEQEEK